MANETGAQFARDLGYLDKFFTNLTAHADTLPAAQGARLKQLIGEEVVRWKEIRQLIAGQGGAAPAPATTASPAPAPAPSPAPTPAAAAPASSGKGELIKVDFTVGSLLGQPKK